MPKPNTNNTANTKGKNKPAGGKPEFDEAAYNQALARYTDEYANAPADSSWVPPVGEYVCELIDIRRGTYVPKADRKGAGEEHMTASPVFQVKSDLDGDDELAGGVFSKFTSTAVMGILKSTLAAINGEVIDDLQAAVQSALEQRGSIYHVSVTAGKKPDFPNIRIVERYES